MTTTVELDDELYERLAAHCEEGETVAELIGEREPPTLCRRLEEHATNGVFVVCAV